VIDLHSHVLPGVDDGAVSPADSLAIVRAAAADGVRVLAATPHVRDDYPTSADTIERLVGELRAAVAEEGIPVELVSGGELSLALAASLDTKELRRLSLGGSGTLLLEFPYYGWPLELDVQLFGLRTRGFRIVLAHPERNGEVQVQPKRLRPLVEAGALVQLTAASLVGSLGRTSQQAARRLIELGLAHLIGSDAHGASAVRSSMGSAAAAVGDEHLARWLTEDVPAAVLAGEPLPDRPRRRGLLSRISLRA
jgi:protein-tyrosine phosphatase